MTSFVCSTCFRSTWKIISLYSNPFIIRSDKCTAKEKLVNSCDTGRNSWRKKVKDADRKEIYVTVCGMGWVGSTVMGCFYFRCFWDCQLVCGIGVSVNTTIQLKRVALDVIPTYPCSLATPDLLAGECRLGIYSQYSPATSWGVPRETDNSGQKNDSVCIYCQGGGEWGWFTASGLKVEVL